VFAEILSALRWQMPALPPNARARLGALLSGEPAARRRRVSGTKPQAVKPPPPDPVWPPARLSLVQRLWGEGFVEVGGADMALALAVGLSPSPQVSLLDMSAGLGGAARALHERFGVCVTGMEAHPGLARLGAELSRRKGMAKEASVEHFNPQTFETSRLYNGILARESLFHQPHLGEVLARAVKALAPEGQLVLVDYVRVPSENPNTRYLAWMDSERQPVHPWTADQYSAACKDLGLEVKVFEDMTDTYRRTVLQGWATLLAGLHLGDLGEGEVAALVDEAELWLRRVMAFDHHALRVIRLHATAPRKG